MHAPAEQAADPGPLPNADPPGSPALAAVYDELRALAGYHMRSERRGHTLTPTAIVHEVYLRLAEQDAVWGSRAHFFAAASCMIRRILVDHARRHAVRQRGMGVRASIADADDQGLGGEVELLALDEALTQLAALDGRQARVVELRFFGGLSVEETAEVVGVGPATVKADWRIARAWLARRLA